MSIVTDLLNLLDGYLGSAQYFPFLLLGTGIFLTFYLKFPQIRFFNHAMRVVRGRYDKAGDEGDATHFQALTTAISGTVGTGNIGGVALAIYLGGPAALFWMWMTAFFGMTTKFAEVTLSHKYRSKDDKGHIVGGPMYVMEKRLNMKWLAIVFAAATVISSFGSGNLPQSNNIAAGLNATFAIPQWVSGAVLATFLGLVVVGGITRIVKVAQRIVPTMSIIYFVGGLAVLISNYDQVIPSFLAIFQFAFTGTAAAGGFLGATFAYAFNRGVNRGLFSNEAGQGSAPIAHAAARAHEPVSEGMVSILEPFIDTILICTLTGLVILSSGVWSEKHHNEFQRFDTVIVAGQWHESQDIQREALFKFYNGSRDSSGIKPFSGELEVREGVIQDAPVTVLHNRSVAEDVMVYALGEPYSGTLAVTSGATERSVRLQGRSLVHSVDLTSIAFSRSFLGDWGSYIVTIGLVLFAFSTAVAWSYYGDRATIYLFGMRAVLPYRILYVAGFFVAAITDTTIVWLVSAVTVALMTLPNLFSLLLLHREMRETIAEYWSRFHEEYPEERVGPVTRD